MLVKVACLASFSSATGLVVLIALAAKNAILIVEFAQQDEAAGMSPVEAAVRAARDRLRPILMTSLAFVLGVLPLTVATGAGAEVQKPIATVVIGGLVTSTLLTLILVPVLYELVERGAAWAGGLRGRRAARRRAAEQAGPLAVDRLDVEVTGRDGVGSRVRVVVRYTVPTRLPLVGRALDDVVLTASATMRVER